MLKPVLMALLLCCGAGAQAALRDYCPDRPGLDTPACTMDPGHVSIELGLVDWTLDKAGGERSDTILAGDISARLGLGESSEIQLDWAGYGRERTRDAAGAVSKAHRAGDLTVALRRNLRNPDGSGLSIALMPFATLPVGRQPIGAGDWGGGMIGAMSIELNDVVSLALSPEIDAAVDESGDGRHLAYGSAAGLSAKLTGAITASVELAAMRDRDPSGPMTTHLAGLSLGWQPKDGMQFDMGANAGLDHHSPDVELYLGISRRF